MNRSGASLLLPVLLASVLLAADGLVFPLEHASVKPRQEKVLTTFHFLAHGTMDVEIEKAPRRSTRVLGVYPMATYQSVHADRPAADLCAFGSAVRVEIGPYPSGNPRRVCLF